MARLTFYATFIALIFSMSSNSYAQETSARAFAAQTKLSQPSPVGSINGVVDGVYGASGGQYIQGWACETNNPNSVMVDIYTDGYLGSDMGKIYGRFPANSTPGDAAINQACGTPGSSIAHRYFIPVSGDLFLRQGQTIWIYGICPDGCANASLSGSKNYTIPAPTTLGSLDIDLSTGVVGGWAFDNLAPGFSIQIQLFADGNAEQGNLVATISANGSRPDVDSAYGITGNHGFSTILPASLTSGFHKIYAYAKSLNGALAPIGHAGGTIIASGGTDSIGGKGMHDLAVAADTAHYRAGGGQLYVHETGWLETSEADRQAIAALFPQKPIFESSTPQAEGSLRQNILPYWPKGVSVLCVQNNGDDTQPFPAADVTSLRNATQNIAQYIGVTYTPNGGKVWETPFSDSSFDWFRASVLAGGAYCVDAPPQFYLQQEPSYRDWVANSINWAMSHGVVVVGLVFPMQSADLWSDTNRYVEDLEMRNAVPTVWALDGYYGGVNVLHPIGSESDPQDSMYTALQLLQFYPGYYGGSN